MKSREIDKEAVAAAERNPLTWLLTLEMARQCGDFDRAAAAKRELARLGVKVTYSPPRIAKVGQQAAEVAHA